MAQLMTTSEFNKKIRAWAFQVKNKMEQNVVVKTSGTGNLAGSIRFRQKFFKGETESIGFNFVKHGVFVQYGAGRGYIVKNGVIVRGHRATDAQIQLLLKRGYSMRDAKKVKYEYSDDYRTVRRQPKDWINKPIRDNISELADICGEYHGDKALQHVLQNFDTLMVGARNKSVPNTTILVYTHER